MKFEPKPLNMLPEPIVDKNVLNQEEHKNLCDLLLSDGKFPIYYNSSVGYDGDKDFYFVHNIFTAERGWVGDQSAIELIRPILNKFDIKALIRIKINFYSRTEKLVKHSQHTDFNFECKSALFYVNDNDGYTSFSDETKIPSKANTLVHFNSQIPHHSTNCTDKDLRCTINFNYF